MATDSSHSNQYLPLMDIPRRSHTSFELYQHSDDDKDFLQATRRFQQQKKEFVLKTDISKWLDIYCGDKHQLKKVYPHYDTDP